MMRHHVLHGCCTWHQLSQIHLKWSQNDQHQDEDLGRIWILLINNFSLRWGSWNQDARMQMIMMTITVVLVCSHTDTSSQHSSGLGTPVEVTPLHPLTLLWPTPAHTIVISNKTGINWEKLGNELSFLSKVIFLYFKISWKSKIFILTPDWSPVKMWELLFENFYTSADQLFAWPCHYFTVSN